MSSHLRTVFLRLLALISILLGSVAWASAASASSGYIDVQPNSVTNPTDNVGLLSLNIASDMPITSLTVTIVPEGGGTPLLSLPMSDFAVPTQDGTGAYGTWELTSPITTTQLPIGSYGVDVTAASADASVSNVSAGTFNFVNVVEFPTFTSSGTTFNFFNQQVTFTGTATIMAPGGTPQPFADQSVTLTNLDDLGAATTVTTGSDGSFTATVTAASGTYWATSQATPTTAAGGSAFIGITVTPLPVTMKAALTVPHPYYGQADEVKGTLTYSDHGVATPLASTTVTLFFNAACCGPEQSGTTVTNASGQFTLPIDTKAGGDTWSLKSTGSTYFASASASVTDTVAYPVLIRKFHGTLSAFGAVQIQACIVAGAGKVEAQYAAKAGGPWHNLGPWRPRNPSVQCQIGTRYGVQYLGTYSARLASAYYRVVFSASNNNEPAVSPVVHLSRLLTKITSFSVRPRTVAKGGHFTVHGRLWKRGKHGTWSPYGGRRVIVVFRYKGTWYRYRAEPKTSRSGWFSGRFVVVDSSPVFAQYNGDATHFACASKRINIHESRATRAEGRIPGSVVVLGAQKSA